MIKRAVVTLALVSTMAATTRLASAADLAETNAKQRVECLFYTYVWEGGEYGLECLV